MTVASPATNTGTRPAYQGGLARTLVRTLLLFTFVPLVLMASAAYLRARSLIQQQVVSQTGSQMANQLGQMEQAAKIKDIRLEHLMRNPEFAGQIQSVLETNRNNLQFGSLRSEIQGAVQSLSPSGERPTFDQFILMKPDGTVLVASNPGWEKLNIKDDPASFHTFTTGANQSFVVYNVASLYPDQLVLASVAGYRDAKGERTATLVGFTEAPVLLADLQSLISLYPSSDAYFITQNIESKSFVKIDPDTENLIAFEPSRSQDSDLSKELDNLMNVENNGPQSVSFNDEDGRPVLAQTAWSEELHSGVVLEIYEDVLLGQLNSLIPFTVAIFLIALAAMGLVLWLGTNRVFQPLASLAAITQRFSEGDFSQRAEAGSDDEIGLLANSFNHMAEELTGMYRSLEDKVEERTRQIRTAAEVARQITSSTNLDELLERTVQLITEQFNFYQASIFLLDQAGKNAVLRASYGPAAREMLARGHRLEVGSASIMGWVTANDQPRIASDVAEDPIHLRNELLPETRSEIGVPIAVGGLVLGAMDVQSTQPNAFGTETVVTLQTLASQIAVAIQNVELAESTQINFQELERLYKSSHLVAAGQNQGEAFDAVIRSFKDSPFPVAVLATKESETLEVLSTNNPNEAGLLETTAQYLNQHLDAITKFLSGNPVIVNADSSGIPEALVNFVRRMNYQSCAFLPVTKLARLAGLVVIGGRQHTLTSATLQPYTNLTDLLTATLDKIGQTEEKEKQLEERDVLNAVNQAVAESVSELHRFFAELHAQVRNSIGDYAFLVALYDKTTETIGVPYAYEDGQVNEIEPFPLGEGLSSILIRNRRPLLIAENVEQRAAELGAKTVGRPAQSWMGAPMLVQNEPIGALIIQDLEQENVFTESDLSFFAALANQVAVVIHNARLLEESRTRAVQLETAAEIARDISSSLNLDELLAKAVNFIRERFDFYHAAIFLLDLPGEFAIIREATGEAGAQMKRSGHKLGVGSKSIVGYVAGQGEALIVNDTVKDATYYANPLLPNTRAEAAIPLKVGERIVGVLDVQSTHVFAFTDDNIRTLQILADQMAVAVVNSELFAETQEHLAQHRLLHHITTTAASGTTLEEALDSAVNGLQVTLGGDRVAILLAERDKSFLKVRAAVGYSEETLNLQIPFDGGITGWAAEHRRALRVDNVTEDSRYIQGSPNTRSELAVPLIYRNDVLGVLNVESEQIAAYTDDDEEMLGTLGGSLAAIIANARLLEQIRGQIERERALYEITSKIRRSTDIQTILATTASELTKVIGARRAQIKISTEDNGGDQQAKVQESEG